MTILLNLSSRFLTGYICEGMFLQYIILEDIHVDRYRLLTNKNTWIITHIFYFSIPRMALNLLHRASLARIRR